MVARYVIISWVDHTLTKSSIVVEDQVKRNIAKERKGEFESSAGIAHCIFAFGLFPSLRDSE